MNPCNSDQQCAAGTRCAFTQKDEVNGKCCQNWFEYDVGSDAHPKKRVECKLKDRESCVSDVQCESEWCDFKTKVCNPRFEEGHECRADNECRSHSCARMGADADQIVCCPGASQLWWGHYYCVMPDGAPCKHNVQCATGICGDDNKCTSKKPTGQSCEKDKECQSGACGRVGANADQLQCCRGESRLWWAHDYCPMPPGSPCKHDVQCDSYRCNSKNVCE